MLNNKVLLIPMALLAVILVVSLSLFTFSNTSTVKVLAILPNAPAYTCAEGLPASQCAQLKLTCGNGAVDPGEDCKVCAFDAGCSSGLVCGNISGGDEFTCHYPAGLCLAGPAG
ncbi:MAG TPA: hypothetical protein VIH27_00500 [Nitrososphaerales archaeon]